MKSTKVLSTTFLLFFSILCNAQEQQNDETIREKISWINKFGFKNTVPINDTLLKPKQIFFGEAVRDIFYFYDTKDNKSVTVAFEDKLTNKMTLTCINGEYKIYISDLFTAGYTVISNEDLGTINFGTNKENALKTYKTFEDLFYLLKWEVECINKLSDNK
ncbi:hypothetical protein [Croceibacter atlanticus]|jgi:hypothetical protein|uniref:DUF4468 domain-containing protein n=1 Tax=Croceibacter atlanticus (strain ATCC BAA-628 / JCM 21780 / CIP 108009 / IAM 15332 / KCTC 12090 / HTCC2559) TaxID=216432 RepID=A3U7B1_CROAH|nr:hypothetical protein [Croceibacter atlanticus]EAP88128.1 hypothetical protein CA2559_05195 [Croceibacter atlanticus HTCC2559]MBW4969666.1 hypothetical protein [Croceibacter atlanticus]